MRAFLTEGGVTSSQAALAKRNLGTARSLDVGQNVELASNKYARGICVLYRGS